jgi:hypothetical protein
MMSAHSSGSKIFDQCADQCAVLVFGIVEDRHLRWGADPVLMVTAGGRAFGW